MKVDRVAFLSQLEIMEPALDKSSDKTIAWLQFWFEGKYAHAYDGGLCIRVPLETEFVGGVPGATLIKLLKGAVGKETTLELKDDTLLVVNGRSRVNLKPVLGVGGQAFRPPQDTTVEASLTLTEDFLDAARRLLEMQTSLEPMRVEHRGVSLFDKAGATAMYVTDSRRLTQITIPEPLPPALNRVVLPFALVRQLVRRCGPGSELVVLKDRLEVRGTGVTLSTNWLDNSAIMDLPAFADNIAAGANSFFDPPDGLGATLKRAELLMSPKEQQENACVNLKISDHSMEVKGAFTKGDLEDNLALGEAAPGEISVSARFLSHGLGETETMAFTPNAVVCRGQKEYLYVVAAK